MSLESAVQDTQAVAPSSEVVNDFSIQVATVNGSGSQTANLVLIRSLFQMGIPVSGKNLFPSNIAGLPTWYTIRASKHGYIGRKKEIDLLVAMNPETAQDDVRALDPGAVVVYDEPLKLNQVRDDLVFYPVPFDELVKPICLDAKLRRLVRNMIYDGVLGKLLNIDMAEMDVALNKLLGKKAKAVTLNQSALKAGYAFAEQRLSKRDPFRVARMNENGGKFLIEANAAIAVGAMMAGVTVVTWYPITPSTTVVETLIDYLKQYRMDPETGKATFAVVQAEDELASIGMALGAGWAGARAMTSTSGPGVSLMSEFVGLGYYTEVPAVIINVQRVGPSTGLPTRTAQGDMLSTAVLSHGDTKHLMLIPSSAEECYEFTMKAFDLAERFQTPVFVMTDLDLGMNTWMADTFRYPETPIDRGKRLDAATLARITDWGRYMDVDGDGIPWRTVPGDGMPAYFNRGSGHNAKGQYTERAEDYTANVDRLARKFETARQWVPVEDIHVEPGAAIALVAYGSSHASVEEARDQLRAAGIRTSYLRLKAYPFTHEVERFIDAHTRVYVIEQNRDAQMLSLLKLDLSPSQIGKLRSVLYYTGLPIDARSISDEVAAQESETVKG